MRVKIQLDTMEQAKKFNNICSTFDSTYIIQIEDSNGHCVDAKSLLGILYSLEFTELWCNCNKDIYSAISSFVI